MSTTQTQTVQNRSPKLTLVTTGYYPDLKKTLQQSATTASAKFARWAQSSPLEKLIGQYLNFKLGSSESALAVRFQTRDKQLDYFIAKLKQRLGGKQDTIYESTSIYEDAPPPYSPMRKTRNIFLVTRAIRSATSIDSAYKAGSWCDTFGHWFVVFGNAPTFDTGYEVTGDGVMSRVHTTGLKTTMKIYVGSTSLRNEELETEAAATWKSFNSYSLHANNCQNFATAFIHRVANQDLNEYAWPLRFSRLLAWVKASIASWLVVIIVLILCNSLHIAPELISTSHGWTFSLQSQNRREKHSLEMIFQLLLPFIFLVWMINPFFLRREGFLVKPVKVI